MGGNSIKRLCKNICGGEGKGGGQRSRVAMEGRGPEGTCVNGVREQGGKTWMVKGRHMVVTAFLSRLTFELSQKL